MTNDTKGKRSSKSQGNRDDTAEELATGFAGIPSGLAGSGDDRRTSSSNFAGSGDDR